MLQRNSFFCLEGLGRFKLQEYSDCYLEIVKQNYLAKMPSLRRLPASGRNGHRVSRRLAGRCIPLPSTRTRWRRSCCGAAMPARRSSRRGRCAGSCS